MSSTRSETPCGIRHVDLSAPLTDLACAWDEAGLLAVFWWDGFPMGRRIFTRGECPVPAVALAAIGADAVADALAARDEVADPTEPGALAAAIRDRAALVGETVSVIVCSRDRPDDLARCLASLAACDPAPDEIVVVDNSPGSPEVRALVAATPRARLVVEPRPGLSRARNAGVAAARGGLLLFTDDDVEVPPGWLVPVRAAFPDPAVGCVTGQVLPARLDSPAAFSFEVDYGGLAGSQVPRRIDARLLDQPFGEAPPVWQVGAGANMAIRRAVIDAVGGFDERLGAGAAGCSEDSEFFHRALAAGWVCRYEPLAAVVHHHRDSLAALRAQMRAYMRGHVAALFVQYAQTRHPGNLMRALVGLPWHFATLGLRLVVAPIGLRRQVYGWEVLGFLEGPLAWLRRCRQPKFSPDPKVMTCPTATPQKT